MMREHIWEAFTLAEPLGKTAVLDTYNHVFAEVKNDYRCLTWLAMVLNHKCWKLYECEDRATSNSAKTQYRALSELYGKMYDKENAWALRHLKGSELRFYEKLRLCWEELDYIPNWGDVVYDNAEANGLLKY